MKKFLIIHKNRIFRYIVILSFFSLFFMLCFLYHQQKIIDINKEKLQILADEKAYNVNMFFEAQKEKLIILSEMHDFIEVVLHPNDSVKFKKAEHIIGEFKKIVPNISILNNDGIVIIGDTDLSENDYHTYPYFKKNEQGILFTQYYDSLRKKDYYSIIGPIYDYGKKIIGKITFDIQLERINDLIKEILFIEDTEVYLINQEGLLLSWSKYIDQDNNGGVLIQEIKNEESIECLEDVLKYFKDGAVEEHEEIERVESYLNYMGDEVFGVHAYVPVIGGCIIAEVKSDKIERMSVMDFLKLLLTEVLKD